MDVVEEVTASPASRLAPSQSVLVVVDVQNDYCHDEGVFGRAGTRMDEIQAAVDRLVAFIGAARRAEVPIVFVRTQHDRWTNSPMWLSRGVRTVGEICATGSWGAELFRVQPAPEDAVVVKHRYSAFVGTRLPVVLRTLARPTFVVAGVTTNVCVESTARDACMRDYHVVLVEDCAAALSTPEHDAAVHNIRTYFGRALASAEIASGWQDSPRSR